MKNKTSESKFYFQNVSVENRGVIFAILLVRMLQWSKNRSIDYARLPLPLWAKNGNESGEN